MKGKASRSRICCWPRPAGGEAGKIGFSRGRFDHPVYDASLYQRRLGINSGWALASNFVDWPHPVGFGPVDPPVDDAPRTLPELERALRAARDRDATQPWHAFFFGQAAWAQGRREEAAAEWDRMLAGPYPATPYYEYAYMAALFEKAGQPNWADRAFAQSLARRRRMAQPVGISTAIERMIDAPFVLQRIMPSLRDERAFVWLQRAQALTGVCGEGDDAASALWKPPLASARQTRSPPRPPTRWRIAPAHSRSRTCSFTSTSPCTRSRSPS